MTVAQFSLNTPLKMFYSSIPCVQIKLQLATHIIPEQFPVAISGVSLYLSILTLTPILASVFEALLAIVCARCKGKLPATKLHPCIEVISPCLVNSVANNCLIGFTFTRTSPPPAKQWLDIQGVSKGSVQYARINS